MAAVERSEAQTRVRNAMLAAGIPLTSVTARCMFEPTLAPTTGRNECQFGPTPVWDHLVGPDGNMPESELNEWIEKLVRSGQTRQAAASMGAKVEGDPGFEIGKVYRRREDIHAHFGGQQQGGIATPAEAPLIFLFTGTSGEQYGYSDGWRPDGVFVYTGEGQEGDMRFRGGNKAILDHAGNGKDLMLFEHLGKRQGYRYVGAFTCSSFEHGRSNDINGHERSIIRFHLIPISDADGSDSEHIEPDDTTPNSISLRELRERAMRASSDVPERHAAHAKASLFRRSAQIKLYVLARAQGNCEACNQPAPFLKKNGVPYLEPHHTRRLSDGGPDDPRWVAAICPTCHRRIHHGQGGEQLNRTLQDVLRNLEATPSPVPGSGATLKIAL